MTNAERPGRGVTRRTILTGGTVALAGVALAACGAPGAGPAQGGQSQPLKDWKPVTLEFWGSLTDDLRKDQINAWNARYPNLKVNYGASQATGQGAEGLQKLISAVAAGSAPDAVDFDRFQVATYANRGVFRSMDDLIKRDKYDTRRFAPAVMDEAMGLDKKPYGLPRSTDNRMLFWNKDAFQEVGLDPEKPPTTWDELRLFAIRLTKRGGVSGFERVGFHTEEGQSHLHLFAWQNGGGFQTPDGKRATLPTAPNQEALQWMADLMKDVGVWSALVDFRTTWGTNAQNAFLMGQVGMHYQTNNFPAVVARYRPEMRFGATPPPVRKAGDKTLTWSGGAAYVLSRESKGADAAWELMKWLVTEEGWTVGWEGEVSRVKALGGHYLPYMTGQPELDKKMFDKYKTGIASVDRVPEMAVPLMDSSRFRELSIAASDIWDAVKAAQLQAVSQQKSAKQALEDNNVLAQTALDQAWAAAPK